MGSAAYLYDGWENRVEPLDRAARGRLAEFPQYIDHNRSYRFGTGSGGGGPASINVRYGQAKERYRFQERRFTE
jgi:hypothetical protein